MLLNETGNIVFISAALLRIVWPTMLKMLVQRVWSSVTESVVTRRIFTKLIHGTAELPYKKRAQGNSVSIHKSSRTIVVDLRHRFTVINMNDTAFHDESLLR